MSTIVKEEQDNRHKILNAAEMLFAKNGFDATSLRAITSEAGVNTALVNYYFQSKDRLIVEVLSRAIRPLNEERLRLLKEVEERTKPSPVSLRDVLGAMIRPCLDLTFDPERRQISQLLIRALSEAENFIQEITEKEWLPVDAHFTKAFQAVLPHVSEEQIFWRIHFTIGAMIHLTCGHKKVEILSQGKCRWEQESVLNELIDYAAAGMQAPVSSK